MRTLTALARWELRLALRSTRCKVALLVYLVLCGAPPVMFFFLARAATYGSATFLGHLMEVQPFLTIVLAVLVAGHRSGAAAWPQMWPVLASSPLGNAGYLLGRWVSMVGLLLPVTALPVAFAAAAAVASGSEWQDPWAWVGSWCLRVAPMVLVTTAMWLGMVTILGGEVAALAATFAGLQILVAIANRQLFKLRLSVDLSLTLGSFTSLVRWIQLLGDLTSSYREQWASRFALSEAPFDARAVAEWLFPQLLVGAAVSAFVLAVAVAWVRRTRRDMKPRPVRPDHPLRTYKEAFVRRREQLTPSAGLARRDLLVLACGVLVLAGGVAANVERQVRFRELALERFETASGDPFEPTAAEVEPGPWKIRGELHASGEVDLEVRFTLSNSGGETHDRLAFSLNEHLEVTEVEAAGRQVRAERSWDRVRLTLEPPLGPGETVELRWRLGGTPGQTHFPLWGRRSENFHARFGRFRTARFPGELSDLSLSRTHRAASRRRVLMKITELSPVPRYTPWTLAEVDHGYGQSLEVPEEIVLPRVEVEVDLSAPASWLLADACGRRSRVEAERSRLAGSCRLPLSKYMVYGGRLRFLEYEGVAIAALEPHLPLAAKYGESLGAVARLSEKAWPGVEGIAGMVVAEWVPLFKSEERFGWYFRDFNLHGKLLLLDESSLGSGYLPEGERLVAELLSRDLAARRPLEPSQDLFLRRTIGALVLQRMGVSRQKDAVISGDPLLEDVFRKPVLQAKQHEWSHWDKRLPAVLFDLSARVGSATLFEVFEKFLSRPTEEPGREEPGREEPGTVEELFALLEEESAVALGRFYDDFVAGGALPKLELAEVSARREGGGFRVTGEVRNRGTGEVVCPVRVKTEVAVVPVRVRIGSEAVSRFEVRTKTKPYAVDLDPEGTCHRLVGRTRFAAEHVDISE